MDREGLTIGGARDDVALDPPLAETGETPLLARLLSRYATADIRELLSDPAG